MSQVGFELRERKSIQSWAWGKYWLLIFHCGVSVESGAECGALGASGTTFDPGLAVVVDSWPTLPEALKAGIVAMVRSVSHY